MSIIRTILAVISLMHGLQVFGQVQDGAGLSAEVSASDSDDIRADLATEQGVSVEVEEPRMPKQPLRESRLWLPPSLDSLQPFLVTAAMRAMNNPDCRDVLYGSVNEFRTEHDEPTFTILCMQNPRHTFNLIFPQSILMPSVPEEVQAETREAEAQLDRLRNLLQSDATTPDNSAQPVVSEPADTDQPPPEVF